jgi:hypothetical protein
MTPHALEAPSSRTNATGPQRQSRGDDGGGGDRVR